MNEFSSIKMELGINARRIISESRVYSEELDKSIQLGVEMGMKEILGEEGGFERFIADAFKESLASSVKSIANDYQLQHKIQQSINKVIEEKVNSISKEWADKLFSSIQ